LFSDDDDTTNSDDEAGVVSDGVAEFGDAVEGHAERVIRESKGDVGAYVREHLPALVSAIAEAGSLDALAETATPAEYSAAEAAATAALKGCTLK